MKDEVETPEDRKILEDWMAAGAPKTMYEKKFTRLLRDLVLIAIVPVEKPNFPTLKILINFRN